MHFSTVVIQIQKRIFIDYWFVLRRQTCSHITQHALPTAPDPVIPRRQSVLQIRDEIY